MGQDKTCILTSQPVMMHCLSVLPLKELKSCVINWLLTLCGGTGGLHIPTALIHIYNSLGYYTWETSISAVFILSHRTLSGNAMYFCAPVKQHCDQNAMAVVWFQIRWVVLKICKRLTARQTSITMFFLLFMWLLNISDCLYIVSSENP